MVADKVENLWDEHFGGGGLIEGPGVGRSSLLDGP